LVHSRGSSGFGFDPVFEPDGWEKTYAEMSEEEKNSISHRGKALEQLKAYLDVHTAAIASNESDAAEQKLLKPPSAFPAP
jgi:hypothetical protein